MTTARKTQGTELFYLSAPDVITKVGGITAVTGTGAAKPKIPASDLDSTSEESIAGLRAPGAISVPLNFDPGNVVHQGLEALWSSASEAKQTWIIGLSDGTAPPTAAAGVITYPTSRTFRHFQGNVADLPIETALNSKYEATMSVEVSGDITTVYKAA